MAPRVVEGEHVTVHRIPGRYTGPSPVLELLPDDSLFTAYYFTGADRVTHVAGTRWRI